MDEIISKINKINEELTNGKSPDSLLIQTISNNEFMCNFIVEYLLGKGAVCYSDALFEAAKHNNTSVINLMLPHTKHEDHVKAYLFACVEGGSAARFILYKCLSFLEVRTCIWNMVTFKTCGDEINKFKKVIEIIDEIAAKDRGLRFYLNLSVAYGSIESNNAEILGAIIQCIPDMMYEQLLDVSKHSNCTDVLINGKHKMCKMDMNFGCERSKTIPKLVFDDLNRPVVTFF